MTLKSKHIISKFAIFSVQPKIFRFSSELELRLQLAVILIGTEHYLLGLLVPSKGLQKRTSFQPAGFFDVSRLIKFDNIIGLNRIEKEMKFA